MKKIISILALSFFLFSCSKEDKPNPKVKVVDKIDIKITANSTGNFQTKKIEFEYNTNKEISKTSVFHENVLYYSYTLNYQNNLPVSSMYDYPDGGNPIYEINYGYTNGKFSSYYDSFYDDTINFAFNQQNNQYTNSINGNTFILNENGDYVSKTASGNQYDFTYITSKKGPLYNVKNKNWIPIIFYGINGLTTIEITTYPITSLFDNNLSQTNQYTNTYDLDGFVVKSVFTINNANQTFEINYTYKSI